MTLAEISRKPAVAPAAKDQVALETAATTRLLEAEGILARIVVPETPVRVEYELTEKGRALEHALSAVGRWAERWVTDVPAAPPTTARATRRPSRAMARARR